MQICTLQTHIEAPRSLPADAKPNDLLHWHTLVVRDVSAIANRLRLNQAIFISPAVVTIPGQILGFKKGILVRDPDGHPLRLVEQPGMLVTQRHDRVVCSENACRQTAFTIDVNR